jgi:hypothetical protein
VVTMYHFFLKKTLYLLETWKFIYARNEWTNKDNVKWPQHPYSTPYAH